MSNVHIEKETTSSRTHALIEAAQRFKPTAQDVNIVCVPLTAIKREVPITRDRCRAMVRLWVTTKKDVQSLNNFKLLRKRLTCSCSAEVAYQIGDTERKRGNHTHFVCDCVWKSFVFAFTAVDGIKGLAILNIKRLARDDHGFPIGCCTSKLRQFHEELEDTGDLAALDLGLNLNVIPCEVQALLRLNSKVVGEHGDFLSGSAMARARRELGIDSEAA